MQLDKSQKLMAYAVKAININKKINKYIYIFKIVTKIVQISLNKNDITYR
jgi:hypothetical protein